jgi:hypothetical protein
MLSIQILIVVEVEVLKPHFEVNMEVRTTDIINMKVNLMEVDKETLEEEEVVEVVVEVVEVNIQIMIGHMAKNCYQREHDPQKW